MAMNKTERIYRRLGGKDEFNNMLERIRKAHNLKVLGSDESADEDGHSAAMVLFGYSNSAQDFNKSFAEFDKALSDVIYLLDMCGLNLSYECNGDGDGCILQSYRIY